MPLTTFDFIFESGNGNRIGNTSQENWNNYVRKLRVMAIESEAHW
jgi:hypothetical protein